jgi:hypothetical protein
MKDEALKLALEAWQTSVYGSESHHKAMLLAMTNMAQAIAAQPAPVQEPVIFYRCNGCGHAYEQIPPTSCDCMDGSGFDRVDYYTTPPAQPAPVQDSTCRETLRAQGKAYPRTCKKCGFGPCIALANAALDRKAENARELGLDYEPVTTLFGSLPVYDTPPAQPAPVQEDWGPGPHEVHSLPAQMLEHEPENEPHVSLASVQGQRPYAYANPDAMSADTAFRWCEIEEFTMPVWTSPPAAQRTWVGLMDDEILKLAYPIRWQEVDDFEADKAVNFAQAIEAKLKEKNT